MPKILIITGPPASGKSSISRRLAEISKRGAAINVDEIRHMIKRGYVAPDVNNCEFARQKELAIRNACALANNFISSGIDVFIDDVITSDKSVKLYKKLLGKKVKIFLLLPSREALIARDKSRGKEHFMGSRTAELWDLFFSISSKIKWKIIDSTKMNIAQTAKEILNS